VCVWVCARGAGGGGDDDLLLFAVDIHKEELLETDVGNVEGDQEASDGDVQDAGVYGKARAAAGRQQAKNNQHARKFEEMGRHPNTFKDPGQAWLASRAQIQASQDGALHFSDVTIPADQARSEGYTASMGIEEGWEAARRVFEEAVRATMDKPDNAASLPGVWRPLPVEQQGIYESLLRLSWPWALKYTRALSFGKRLAVDSIPAIDVLITSKTLMGVGASYASGPDGHKEFVVKNAEGEETAVCGLTGNIESNMLHTFFKTNLTLNDPTKDLDVCVFDGHCPMPANGRKYHQDDIASRDPKKLDIREYNKRCTEGERRIADLSMSTLVYAVKEIRDAHGLPFPCMRMGNYCRLDADIHAARGDRTEIEISDMAHCMSLAH
jgi:hypothetical protein